MRGATLIVCAWIYAASAGFSAEIDQSQVQYEGINDWNSGIAQTFTAGTSCYLRAVNLLVQRNGGERDLKIKINYVGTNDVITDYTLASGILAGSAFTEDVAQWYTVNLDTPYWQTNGETLAFVIEYGSSGTPYGWLEVGHSTNNPYAGGLLHYTGYYGSNNWTYDQGYIDLAFETLVSADMTASLSASNSFGIAPLEVVFTAAVLWTNSADLLHFSWDLDDDGSPDVEGMGRAVVTNIYSTPGTYSVRLTITNSEDSLTIYKPAFVGVAEPADIYVSLDGTHTAPYANWGNAATNIQAALDAAVNGNSILVSTGLYTGAGNNNLDFQGKTVHLRSLGGALYTIIDCAGYGPGFVFHSGESTASILSGFTVQNAGVLDRSKDPTNEVNVFSAVVCVSNSGPRIADCRLIDNHAFRGGGIYVESSSPLIDSCLISGNYASYGGGVYCVNGHVVITNSILSGAKSYLSVSAPPAMVYNIVGGGIYACSNSMVTVRDSRISENQGGGIFCSNSLINVKDTSFDGNYTGGMVIQTQSGPMTQVSREGNGGGVSLASSSADIKNSCFIGNRSQRGSAIDCSAGSALMLNECNVFSNRAAGSIMSIVISDVSSYLVIESIGYSPGAVSLDGSTGTISGCNFSDNTAGNGGAVAVMSGSYVNMYSNLFTRNMAVEDSTTQTIEGDDVTGTVHFSILESSISGLGGALFCESATVVISNCVFLANVAGSGGAAAGICGATQQMSECVFTNNAARGYFAGSFNQGGGALYANNSTLGLDNCRLSGNEAGAESYTKLYSNNVLFADLRGLSGYGGAVSAISNAVADFELCSIEDNVTGNAGGGLFVSATSTVHMSRCLIRGSVCSNIGDVVTCGGGLYVHDSSATLSACAVVSGFSETGAGIAAISNSFINLYNSTLAENTSEVSGGGLYMDASVASIVNSIVWDNESPLPVAVNGGVITGTNSFVSGGINGEPEPANPMLRYGYRLAAGSPCIDAAISSNLPPSDINGDAPWDSASVTNPWPATIQDIGADEFIDSDSDGMDDSWEIYAFAGLSRGMGTDLDGDGLSDVQEYDFNTQPALTDTDFDSLNDYAEWIAGTRGNSAGDCFVVNSCSNTTDGVVIQWDSVVGRTYSVLGKTNIFDASWITNASGILGDGTRKSYTNIMLEPLVFFRLNVTRP